MGLSIEEQRDKIRETRKLKDTLEKEKRFHAHEESVRNFEEVGGMRFGVDCLAGLSGIYFLYKSGKIVYIGESVCLISRIFDHIREGVKVFDSFTISVYSGTNLARKRKERALIRRFKPKYNKTHNTLARKVKIFYGRNR